MLALKENIKMFERKRFGFKLTKIVTDFTYKEKCFLEFRSLGSASSYKKESSGHLSLFFALEN